MPEGQRQQCVQELHTALRAEENSIRQKARIQWLKEGDQNTAFFHKIQKVQQQRKNITGLYNEAGSLVTAHEDIANVMLDYLLKLIGSPDLNVVGDVQLKDVLKTTLSSLDASSLVTSVSADDIKQVLFSLPDNQSPDPDGYTPLFFKSAWRIIGDDVIGACQEFFDTVRLFRAVNSTAITLVPKKPNANLPKDYRPISCCTTLYKCISKLLANRFQKVLSGWISSNQTAFVPGRNINENIWLAHEVVRNSHRSGLTPRCAIKIDLMKAFDSLNWAFLLPLLEAFGFPTLLTGSKMPL